MKTLKSNVTSSGKLDAEKFQNSLICQVLLDKRPTWLKIANWLGYRSEWHAYCEREGMIDTEYLTFTVRLTDTYMPKGATPRPQREQYLEFAFNAWIQAECQPNRYAQVEMAISHHLTNQGGF